MIEKRNVSELDAVWLDRYSGKCAVEMGMHIIMWGSLNMFFHWYLVFQLLKNAFCITTTLPLTQPLEGVSL